MRLKYEFESIDMGNEIVVVPIGNNAEQVKGVLKINTSALEIIELLKKDISEEQIVDELYLKYDDNKQYLTKQVRSVLEALRSNALLVE